MVFGQMLTAAAVLIALSATAARADCVWTRYAGYSTDTCDFGQIQFIPQGITQPRDAVAENLKVQFKLVDGSNRIGSA